MNHHPFDRSGLAALSDLATQEHCELFKVLEQAQSAFLSKRELFRSPDYLWPRDPLHTWSRIWEYPYVYHHLKNWRSERNPGKLPVVADIGSGVTFFPFLVARLGCQVICTDLDPVCEKDLNRAKLHVSYEPGQVDFRHTNGRELAFENQECDAVYCISVLEHIADFGTTIQEIARILKPGGVFLLTIDLDLQGNSEIGVKRYSGLIEAIFKSFAYRFPDSTIHPLDILDSRKGLYALDEPRSWKRRWHLTKQEFIKPLLGMKPGFLVPVHLAVQGFSLQRLPVLSASVSCKHVGPVSAP